MQTFAHRKSVRAFLSHFLNPLPDLIRLHMRQSPLAKLPHDRTIRPSGVDIQNCRLLFYFMIVRRCGIAFLFDRNKWFFTSDTKPSLISFRFNTGKTDLAVRSKVVTVGASIAAARTSRGHNSLLFPPIGWIWRPYNFKIALFINSD